MFSTWPGYNPGHDWNQIDSSFASSATPAISTSSSSTSATSTRTTWTRPLGLIEAKFDIPAQDNGQADTFVRLTARTPTSSTSLLFRRLALAWARLRAQHPSLAYIVKDDPRSSSIPGVKGRSFHYTAPQNEEQALADAWSSLIVESSARAFDSAELVLAEQVLNGPRTLLNQLTCLSRFVVFRDERTDVEKQEHVFLLVISHIISDGISIINLLREFFEFLTLASLPTPNEVSTFQLLSDLGSTAAPPACAVDPCVLAQWKLVPTQEEITQRLVRPTEDLWPPIPLSPATHIEWTRAPSTSETLPPTVSTTVEDDLPFPSIAQKRWYWAITRTIVINRHATYARTLAFPRLPLPSKAPPPRTRWPTIKLDLPTTSKIVSLCKENRISPSMLLYSLLSITVSRIFARDHSTIASQYPIVIGFPCSIRPFLDPSRTPLGSDSSRDLAMRLTFGSITLPYTGDDAIGLLKWRAVKGARLAKKQFEKRFALNERGVFLADNYHRTLDRLLNSAGNNPIPVNEPKTAINASMIGDLDRLLPTSFPLLTSSVLDSTSVNLELSDLLIGTRLHRGEGMLVEAYTWEGKLTVSIGYDDQVFKVEQVEEILRGVEMDLKKLR